MLKKIISVAGTLGVFGMMLIVPIANAQLFSYEATTTPTTSTVSTTAATTSGTTAATSTIAVSSSVPSITAQPIDVIATTTTPALTAGFIQLDGLIVTSVSSADAPATITAANPNFSTMSGVNTWAGNSTPAIMCEQFATDASAVGTTGMCPVPPIASVVTNATSSAASTTTWYSPYSIQVVATTQLLLNNRTTAVLGNFTPGDSINVYGYYNANGTINAEVIRNVSKPFGTPATTVIASTSNIQAEIQQLQNLVMQLEAEIASSTVASSTTSTTAMCPMMTATSSLSTVCPSALTAPSGTVIY